MRTGLRNKVLGGFGVTAVGLVMSSTAYACTTYLGQVTVSGNRAGSGTDTWKADAGMDWCTPTPTPTAKTVAGTLTSKVTLVTASTNCDGNTSVLSTGTYKVAVTPAAAGTTGYMPQGGGTGSVHNCHGTSGTVIDSTATVTAGAFKFTNGTTTSPAYTSGVGSYSVCIYHTVLADAIAGNLDAA